MDEKRIKEEMRNLEKIIEYEFKNIQNLADAMYAQKKNNSTAGKNNNEHANDALATVGDAILKAILTEYIFKNKEENKTRGIITIMKSSLEKNKVLFKVANEKNIYNHAYNDEYFAKDNPPQHSLVANSSKHPTYVEAIVGAVFHDSNFETTYDWGVRWLLPILEDISTRVN